MERVASSADPDERILIPQDIMIKSECTNHSRLLTRPVHTPSPEVQNPLSRLSLPVEDLGLGSRSDHFFLNGPCEIVRSVDEGGIIVNCEYAQVFFSPFVLISDVSRPNLSGMKIIDPNWIDVDLIQRWKTTCDTSHSKDCHKFPLKHSHSTIRPRWLLDTWLMCLTAGKPDDKYVALSYVWGAVEALKTTKATVVQFQEEQAFLSYNIFEQIPQTIKDAIELVKLMHERYLWADTLCIIQDDKDEKSEEINNMGFIYANATLTIIAAEGTDANSGLRGIPGIPGISSKRDMRQQVVKLSDSTQFINIDEDNSYNIQNIYETFAIGASLWSSRGWTFQEKVCSLRTLIFNKGALQWHCSNSSWKEDVDIAFNPAHQIRQFQDVDRGIFARTLPDLYTFAQLVQDYNTRNFTFPADALPGFAGITSILDEAFPGGFHFGLPQTFFDVGLTWAPMPGEDEVIEKRIVPQGGDAIPLPTWSWMCWKGTLDLGTWMFCDFIMPRSLPVVPFRATIRWIIPIVQWRSIDPANGRSKPITNNWCQYRGDFLGENPSLPKGWSRHTADFNIIDRPILQGDQLIYVKQRYYFTHISDPQVYCYNPILLSLQDAQIMHPTAYLLGCSTRRLWLDRSLCSDEEFGLQKHVRLSSTGGDGDFIGVVIPHERGWIEGRFELIAISLGCWFYDPTDELFFSEGPYPEDYTFYEFYNVLWIEWEYGIAYRKGVGRVMKKYWDEHSEAVDVVLG